MLTKGFNLAIIDKREEVYLWRRTMKNDITRFQGDNIEDTYPCGKGCVTGVPYARDYYLAHPEVLSTGKTRDVKGKAAKEIAKNVKKLDAKEGVLSNVFAKMKFFSK